jgi:PAS domain-containing protein
MNEKPTLPDVIFKIEKAGLTPTHWGDALAEISTLLGATSAGLFLHNVQNGDCLAAETWNVDPEAVVKYQEHYASVDCLLSAAMRCQQGHIACGQELVARPDYLNSEHYNDFWRHLDLSDTLSVSPIKNNDHFAHVSFFYPNEFDDPLDTRRHLLLETLPFVENAINAQLRMHEYGLQASAMHTAFDESELGVILLRPSGRIQEANQKAQKILKRKDGLLNVHGRLTASKCAQQKQLACAIAQSTQLGAKPARGDEIAIQRNDDASPYIVTLLPIPAQMDEELRWIRLTGASVLVLIRDPTEAKKVPIDLLRSLYDLTPAEAHFAANFLETASLKASAKAASITDGTARVHLKKIFEKTNSHSQAELMKLLHSLAN